MRRTVCIHQRNNLVGQYLIASIPSQKKSEIYWGAIGRSFTVVYNMPISVQQSSLLFVYLQRRSIIIKLKINYIQLGLRFPSEVKFSFELRKMAVQKLVEYCVIRDQQTVSIWDSVHGRSLDWLRWPTKLCPSHPVYICVPLH